MMALMRSAPDHDHPPMGTGGHELRAGREGVQEPRARGRQVEAPGIGQAELILHQAGGGGEDHVGRHGRDDQRADVVGAEAPLGHEPPDGFRAHRRGGLARAAHPALADAGAA